MPSPPFVSGGLPIAGHTLEFTRDPNGLDRRGQAEHGDIFAFRLANKNVATVSGAEYNKLFYMETDHALNISDVYEFVKAAFGEVLFIAPHDVYMNQRAVLQAIFSRQKMARYVQAMQAEVQLWLDGLGNEGTFDIAQEALAIARSVAGRAFIGDNFRAELGDDFWEDYSAISRSIDPITPPHWPLPKFIRRDKAKARIQAALIPLIEKRRANLALYDDLPSIMLSQPQKDGTLMSDDYMVSMFMGLLFAGHETTAGQAAWTVIHLLQHPMYLELIQAEIAEHISAETLLDGKTLRTLKHTYLAIDETTRLKPSAPMQLRTVAEPLQVGAYIIPKDWLIRVAAETSHFRPEIYTNPYAYDPLRFSAERKEGRNSFNNIGFGGGMHKCTGMNFAKNEMAVIVALLFQQFDVTLMTAETHQILGVGAAHPSATLIHYQRKAAFV